MTRVSEAAPLAPNRSPLIATVLRLAVRDLSLAPPLSEHWLSSSEKLLRVANVSEMEKRLKKEGAPESTLWEGEELALRYLLEDGKLNLTLRLLDQYVDWLADRGKTLTVRSGPSPGRSLWDSRVDITTIPVRLPGGGGAPLRQVRVRHLHHAL